MSALGELQAGVWAQLKAKLERLPHALLLHGAPGVGKLALAERFAHLLLCERRTSAGEACGRCDGCRWFAAGTHPDIRYLEPESIARALPGAEEGEEEKEKNRSAPSTQIKIEQARALADFIHLASHRGGRRIAVIHPADAMNVNTANALLKSLEEPPASAVFLLVSHRPARLLPTIRSRCVPVAVPLPEPGAAARWLEGQGVRRAAGWLAFAGGAPLRALAYATGEQGALIERAVRAVASGDRDAMSAVKDRNELDPLAEVLQKVALDRALGILADRAKYSSLASRKDGDPRAWLAYARAMGRHRALSGHPLNPRLLAMDMVSGMPKV